MGVLIRIILRLFLLVAQKSFIRRFWSQINILVDLPSKIASLRRRILRPQANAIYVISVFLLFA